jgi:predicted nucleotidyltransferase
VSADAHGRPPVVGLALFGSRARGENGPQADVDLLGVTAAPSEAIPAAVHGQVRLSCYPLVHLVRRAEAGDLFVLHVAREAVVLFDAGDVFERIQRSFRYRDDYDREVRLASDLGWFLVRHADRFRSGPALSSRIAWCTRTILIARSAVERRPVFAAAELARLADDPVVERLIGDRGAPGVHAVVLEHFGDVLRRFGATPPPERTFDEQRRAFLEDRNAAGLAALAVLVGTGASQPPLAAAGTREG